MIRTRPHPLRAAVLPRLVTALVLAGLIAPRRALAQAPAQDAAAPGLRFAQGLSWPAARAQAKAAKKHLLLVLETTPCKYCGWMGKVYTDEQVGHFLNARFLAVQVQMDTTPHGRTAVKVKGWAVTARQLARQYGVTTFPTYLFFSPQGQLVHRGQGWKDTPAFLALAAEALDPAKQYYPQLAAYRRGRRDRTVLPALARTAWASGDTATAQQLVGDYLALLSEAERYTKANLELLHELTRRSADPGFALFERHGARVDSALGQAGGSRGLVDWIIAREEIQPHLAAAERGGPSPDWSRIMATITQKYGPEAAERTALAAQVQWYKTRRDWPRYIASLVPYTEKYGPTDAELIGTVIGDLNNRAWDVFLYSTDSTTLTKALAWSARVVDAGPTDGNQIDTYANLLYKLGRRAAGIRWQELAVKLDPNPELAARLEQMKRGAPTWGHD